MKILPPLVVASRKKNADWDKPGSERWGSGSTTQTLTGKCSLQEMKIMYLDPGATADGVSGAQVQLQHLIRLKLKCHG